MENRFRIKAVGARNYIIKIVFLQTLKSKSLTAYNFCYKFASQNLKSNNGNKRKT